MLHRTQPWQYSSVHVQLGGLVICVWVMRVDFFALRVAFDIQMFTHWFLACQTHFQVPKKNSSLIVRSTEGRYGYGVLKIIICAAIFHNWLAVEVWKCDPKTEQKKIWQLNAILWQSATFSHYTALRGPEANFWQLKVDAFSGRAWFPIEFLLVGTENRFEDRCRLHCVSQQGKYLQDLGGRLQPAASHWRHSSFDANERYQGT